MAPWRHGTYLCAMHHLVAQLRTVRQHNLLGAVMSANKFYVLSLAFLISMTFSCEDHELPTEDNKADQTFRVKRLYNPRMQLVSDDDLVTITNLFQTNSLPLSSNWQVFYFDSNAYSAGTKCVCCFEFCHNLKLFNSSLIFWFNSQNQYTGLTGYIHAGIAIDTIPKVTMNEACLLFCSRISNDPIYSDSLSSFKNYGFNAELGFHNLNFDLNYGFNNTPENFGLAWELTVDKGGRYPTGYIRADSLYLIYYNDGILRR